MTSSRILRLVSGSIEIFLAIPLLGAVIVMGSSYMVLTGMFILHIVTLVMSAKNQEPIYGSVLGIITSLIAWIPFVGWVMHLLSGIFLLISAVQRSNGTFR